MKFIEFFTWFSRQMYKMTAQRVPLTKSGRIECNSGDGRAEEKQLPVVSFPCHDRTLLALHSNFDMFPCLDPLGLLVWTMSTRLAKREVLLQSMTGQFVWNWMPVEKNRKFSFTFHISYISDQFQGWLKKLQQHCRTAPRDSTIIYINALYLLYNLHFLLLLLSTKSIIIYVIFTTM